MNKPEENGVAIITGAARGIGLATAETLCAAGYSVALVDQSESEVKAAAEDIAEATGAETLFCVADVADHQACSAAYRKIRKAFAPPAVLVNCAGILVRKKARLEDLPPGDFDEMMAVHVGGTLNWSRLVVPDMRKRGYGRIVNISSVNAVAAVPYRIGYVAAKKAIRGITEALALETARAGITVNAIAPGYILTDQLKARADEGILDEESIAERTPAGRWGSPAEVANAIAFLASKDAAFITGATLVVDGGLTIRGDSGEDLENPPS